MKCHYEVLGLPRDVEDNEIKKAYRKLALKWHPDKNLNDPDGAKEQFQLVQQAYEILSDSHERSWYDNHREQILRGKNSNYEDNCLDVFQYFTVTCFKGYGDDPNGFYAVYSEVFEKIASEDIEFMDDEEDIEVIPKFGNSQSSYEEVVGPFYAYWQSYCTKRSYAWLCKYDISEIKDRRILREVEKDTKKIAQKARKERNEEVRNLVSFIRKRDKRVQAYRLQLEQKAEVNRKKQEQLRLEQIRRRNKEMEEMRKSQGAHSLKPDGYEEQLRLLEQEYGDTDSESSYSGEENNSVEQEDDIETEYYDDLYCVACYKSFKNQNAFFNHESSQKHTANVEKLKIKMQTEETEFNNNENQLNLDGVVDNSNKLLETLETLDNIEITDNIEISDNIEITDEDEIELKINSKKKNKKLKKQMTTKTANEDASEINEEIPDMLANLKEDTDDWSDKGKKSSKKLPKNKKNQSRKTEIISDVSQPKEPLNSDVDDLSTRHICVTCKTVFDSKNKLFKHLKSTNHGVYIPKTASGAISAQSIRKKKLK